MQRDPLPPPGAVRPSARPGVLRTLGLIAFALAPFLTLGFATPVAFILAAALFSYLGRWQAAVLWTSAVVYSAALMGAFATVATVDVAAGTAGETVLNVCIILTVFVGGLQAFVFALVAGIKGYRAGGTRPRPPAQAEPAAVRPAPPPVWSQDPEARWDPGAKSDPEARWDPGASRDPEARWALRPAAEQPPTRQWSDRPLEAEAPDKHPSPGGS
jgi:hypothetical protein